MIIKCRYGVMQNVFLCCERQGDVMMEGRFKIPCLISKTKKEDELLNKMFLRGKEQTAVNRVDYCQFCGQEIEIIHS